MALLQVLSLYFPPSFRYSSKYIAQVSSSRVGVPLWYTKTAWQLESSVNILNLLWLSRRLIITTEKTNISIRTFPNTLTYK